MTVWRPPAAIRVKAIGLLLQADHLFAFDVPNDAGNLDGVRPLGGTIDFGETREAALRREFREELASGIDILGPGQAFGNIFTQTNRVVQRSGGDVSRQNQPGCVHQDVALAPERLLVGVEAPFGSARTGGAPRLRVHDGRRGLRRSSLRLAGEVAQAPCMRSKVPSRRWRVSCE